MELTYENIKDILLRGDFSLLKDQYENEFIDVKEFPYNLDNEHGKEELCKDISAILNNKGGFILLGIKYEEDPNHRFDRIKEVVGVNMSVNEQQYLQCLENGMYPIEPSIGIKKCTLDNKEIFYIEIPPSSSKPFLRKKSNDFQYWIRTGSHATQLNIARLHELSRRGLEYEDHLMHIENTLDELVGQSKVYRKPISLDNLKRQL